MFQRHYNLTFYFSCLQNEYILRRPPEILVRTYLRSISGFRDFRRDSVSIVRNWRDEDGMGPYLPFLGLSISFEALPSETETYR